MATDTPESPAEAGSDGWIKHDGGPCPVAPETKVEIRTRESTSADEIGQADWFVWWHNGGPADIIAYRLAEPADAPSPVEAGAGPRETFRQVAREIERGLTMPAAQPNDEFPEAEGFVVLRVSSARAVLAALAAHVAGQGVVPDGWRLVPVKPTLPMLNAGWARLLAQRLDPEEIEVEPIYRAMIDATPIPAPVKDGQGAVGEIAFWPADTSCVGCAPLALAKLGIMSGASNAPYLDLDEGAEPDPGELSFWERVRKERERIARWAVSGLGITGRAATPPQSAGEPGEAEIDRVAKYLRDSLQAAKELTPWELTPKARRKKWLVLVEGAFRAAAQVRAAQATGRR